MYIILIALALVILASICMYKLITVADKFFRRADEIESWIRANEPKEKIVSAIFALKKDSFHRQTGSRLNELAKMAEVKYNIKLLKN